MQLIQLPRGRWQYDPESPLGAPGGFGAVFAGHSEILGDLAIKRLHLEAHDAAHREMRIANELVGKEFHHVIPVLDAGEDPDTGAYFVVMPRAQRSLQDALDRGGVFSDHQAAGILRDSLAGLSELPEIVHRDLKPGNVLEHAGHWKVADFGIAMFVEDTTSLRTLKDCLSPLYAAPEQWKYERATGATDVYALGCIAFALVTGSPPFSAQTTEELRKMHVEGDPPSLSGVSPRLQSLISMMLRKPPEARPNRERIGQILKTVIGSSQVPAVAAYDELALANAHVAKAEALREAEEARVRAEDQRREELASVGRSTFEKLAADLSTRIVGEAPAARPTEKGSKVAFGNGLLWLGSRRATSQPPVTLARHWFLNSEWDVLLGQRIGVWQQEPEYEWTSSLWFCRRPGTESYRWYECSYFSPFTRSQRPYAPYDLTHEPREAALVMSPGVQAQQFAWGPHPVDDEDADEFCERWAALLAKAARGQLAYPSILPLSRHFWRTAR